MRRNSPESHEPGNNIYTRYVQHPVLGIERLRTFPVKIVDVDSPPDVCLVLPSAYKNMKVVSQHGKNQHACDPGLDCVRNSRRCQPVPSACVAKCPLRNSPGRPLCQTPLSSGRSASPFAHDFMTSPILPRHALCRLSLLLLNLR